MRRRAGSVAHAVVASSERPLLRFEKQKSAVEIKNRHVLGAETERVVAKKSKSNVMYVERILIFNSDIFAVPWSVNPGTRPNREEDVSFFTTEKR